MNWRWGWCNLHSIYEFATKKLNYSQKKSRNQVILKKLTSNLDSKEVNDKIGEDNINKLKEDIELITEMIPELDHDEFLAGIQTPVFLALRSIRLE